MAYDLSFAEAFFWGDGSVPSDDLPRTHRPTSVYQALKSLSETQWRDIARDVFSVEPAYLDLDTVMAQVLDTNTCSNLDSPVSVWIDPDGFYTVLVY